MVKKAIDEGNKTVLKDCRRIAGAYEADDWIPESPKAISNRLFHTVYMGVASHSSPETRKRAEDLAKAIGSFHIEADIDEAYHAFQNIAQRALNFTPKFDQTATENLSLQNIQSRSRLVLAYNLAALLPTSRGRPGQGALLVLGSANVDECLRGYFTVSYMIFGQ
jgi:NAD+ synthase (glutamine-hydrolysing)